MAKRSPVPPAPDFEAMEAAAGAMAGQRAELFGVIGNLVYSWSNNESLLVYLIMLLLETDRPSALIVFGTLNTTRARVDLVQRLARVKVADRETAKRLKSLLARFEAGTKTRNDLLHALYSVDGSGRITHTHAMRLEEKGQAIRFGMPRAMDEARLETLRGEIQAMTLLNRELWQFLPILQTAVEARGEADAPRRNDDAPKRQA